MTYLFEHDVITAGNSNEKNKEGPCKYVTSTLRSTSHDALCWGNSCCERADPNNKIYKNNRDILLLWSTNSEMIDEDKLLQWWTLRDISPRLPVLPQPSWTWKDLESRSQTDQMSELRFPAPGVYLVVFFNNLFRFTCLKSLRGHYYWKTIWTPLKQPLNATKYAINVFIICHSIHSTIWKGEFTNNFGHFFNLFKKWIHVQEKLSFFDYFNLKT